MKCSLADELKNKYCGERHCPACGWNPAVQEQRAALMAENGLTLCEDGLRRLALPGKEDDSHELEI